MAYPLWKGQAVAVLRASLLLLYGSVALGKTAWLDHLTAFLKRPWAHKGALYSPRSWPRWAASSTNSTDESTARVSL